ncbi:MAG: segregation and condensation protein A [Kiritimatiellia bacterium]|jgi:segregation and condensation protein A
MHASLERWTIHTEVFEGPLDLLLHLVRREGVDLRRIKIAVICDAYLDYLDRMRELHLNVAGDYLVMAATLCHLKALALLTRSPTPTTDDGEEEQDPTEALAERLERYQRYKQVAKELDERPLLNRDVFVREPEPVDVKERPISAGIDAFGLLDLYYGLLAKAAEAPPVHVIPDNGPDLERCCYRILSALDLGGGHAELGSVLRAIEDPGERVTAFIAALEMARLHWLGISQDEHLGPVHLWFEDREAVDIPLLTGRMVQDEDGASDDG